MNSGKYRPDLTVFVPTRSRSKNAVDFGSNFTGLCDLSTELVFVLDEDDPELGDYLKRIAGRWSVEVVSSTQRGMVDALNVAYRRREFAGTLGFAVGFMGDDHRPRTEGWDAAYVNTLEDLGTGFVYGNDLLQGQLMPTQVAFTADIARELGWMAPPCLHHLCVDLVWLEIGRALDKIIYLDDVIIEHMHPLAGKARMDRGYRVANSTVMARHDSAAYERYLETDFPGDVAKLKDMIDEGIS